MHDCLAITLAECPVERISIMCCQVVFSEGLASIFVYSLEHLYVRLTAVPFPLSLMIQPYMLLRNPVQGKESEISSRLILSLYL